MMKKVPHNLKLRRASPRRDAYRVAACIDTREGPGRERLLGVTRYATGRDWCLFLVRSDDATACRQMAALDLHGAILYDREPRLHQVLRDLGVPVVEACARNLELDDAAVFADDEKICELAVEHLLAMGFEHFGYCSLSGSHQSLARAENFNKLLEQRGFLLAAFAEPWQYGPISLDAISRWLAKLPRPAGVLASDDRLAEHVLTACHVSGIKVPDEIGVLGVGNDELMCELTYPRLSSIALPMMQIGWRAAEVLDGLMRGQPPGQRQWRMSPLEVIGRASTDKLLTTDPAVAAAILYLRANGLQPIGTDQVADAVGVTRRTLERRFTVATGRTVHEFLMDLRLNEAKHLLRQSDAPLNEIACQCGYLALSSFIHMFTAGAGCHPTAYRKQYRL